MKKPAKIGIAACTLAIVSFIAWIVWPTPPDFPFLADAKFKRAYYSDREETPYVLGNYGATVMRSYEMPGKFEDIVERIGKEVTPHGYKFGGTSPDDKTHFFTPRGEAATHTDRIVVINRGNPVTIEYGLPLTFRDQMRRSFGLN